MKRLLLLGLAAIGSFMGYAQLFSRIPASPTKNDAAQNLVITIAATKSSKGLLNCTPATDVSMHAGVIINSGLLLMGDAFLWSYYSKLNTKRKLIVYLSSFNKNLCDNQPN